VSGGRAICLSARREIRERLASRAFLVSTAIQVLIVVAIVVVIGLTAGDEAEKFDLGYVGPEARAVVDSAIDAEASIDAEISSEAFDDQAAARSALADDELDAAVAGGDLLTTGDPSQSLNALLQEASRQARGFESLRGQGLSDEQIRAALDPPPLPVEEVAGGSEGQGIAAIGSLLLYIAILSYGILVATAVVTEKSTRVVEVVLAAIRPIQLLAGKVIGIGLIGILQLLVIGGVGIALALALGQVELPATTGETALLVFVFFVLGYLLYASAYAVAGAIVSRQEDVQSSSAPLTILLIVDYLASTAALGAPDSGIAVVCTFVPPLAPMVVPARAAQDALPGWELALSLALTVVFVVVLIWLAARVYERAVLRMGAPLKLRSVLRLAREPAPR
jgi:ABC-2 type transport system permease protein